MENKDEPPPYPETDPGYTQSPPSYTPQQQLFPQHPGNQAVSWYDSNAEPISSKQQGGSQQPGYQEVSQGISNTSPSHQQVFPQQPGYQAVSQDIMNTGPTASQQQVGHPQQPRYQAVSQDITNSGPSPSQQLVAPQQSGYQALSQGFTNTGPTAIYDQSTNTVIIAQPGTLVIKPPPPRPSTVRAMVTACLVTWFCCPVIGIVAIICAVQARKADSTVEVSRKLRCADAFSVAALLCGIVFIFGIYQFHMDQIRKQV